MTNESFKNIVNLKRSQLRNYIHKQEKLFTYLIFLSGLIYLIVRFTDISYYIIKLFNIAGFTKRKSNLSFPKIALMIFYLLLFIISNLYYVKLENYLSKIKKYIDNIYTSKFKLGIILFFCTLLSMSLYFGQVKLHDLIIPDKTEDNKIWIWQNGTKKLTDYPKDRTKVIDESRNMVIAREISLQGFKNYFHLYNNSNATTREKGLLNWGLSLHPPLYYLFLSLFGENYILMRYSSVIIFSLCVLLCFIIISEIFNTKFGLLSALFYFSIPLFIVNMGVRADNDLFPALLFLISLYFAVKSIKTTSKYDKIFPFLSGVFLGLSYLSKYSAFLAILPYGVFWLISSFKKKKNYLINYVIQLVASMVIFFPWIFLAYGTTIGSCQYKQYISKYFRKALQVSHFGQAKSAIGFTVWKFFIFLLPNELGPPLFLLCFLGGIYFILDLPERWKEESFFIYWPILFIFQALLVNPLLRYASPIFFCFGALASFALFEAIRSNKMRLIVFLSLIYFSVAKSLIYIIEYSGPLAQYIMK